MDGNFIQHVHLFCEARESEFYINNKWLAEADKNTHYYSLLLIIIFSILQTIYPLLGCGDAGAYPII